MGQNCGFCILHLFTLMLTSILQPILEKDDTGKFCECFHYKILHIKTFKTHEATVLRSISLQVKFNREAYCYSTEGFFIYIPWYCMKS